MAAAFRAVGLAVFCSHDALETGFAFIADIFIDRHGEDSFVNA